MQVFPYQDVLHVFIGAVFSVVGAALSLVVITRTRSSNSSFHLGWVALSGFVLGTALWISHFILILGLANVEPEQFAVKQTYGSLVVSIALGFVASLSAMARARNLSIVAGFVFGFAVLAGHVSAISSIDYHRAIEVARLNLPISAVVALSLSALGFLSLRYRSRPSAAVSVFLLAAAIFMPHQIALSGIVWNPEPSIIQKSGSVTADFVFGTLIVIGGIMISGTVGILLLDRQHISSRMMELERFAFVDGLTGLPNRLALEQALPSLQSDYGTLQIFTIGFSNYRNVVDVFGHTAADALLLCAADAAKTRTWFQAFGARVSEDRFVVVSHASSDQATSITARFADVIASVDGLQVQAEFAIGVARYPEDGSKVSDVLTRSDLALGRALRSGAREVVEYDALVDEPNREKSALAIDLRHALKLGQFELAYQRQNSVNDGRIVGYEVLLRWNHPVRGRIPPDVFIPIAERDGLIEAIGEWVLIEACKEAATWVQPRKIAVNVSARQLANDNFPEVVAKALVSAALPAGRLEIEITETGIFADKSQALKIVSKLCDLGVSVAMDDYGTGYSSLSTLKSFPFSKVKIDRAFISEIENDPHAAAIVKSTLSLCRDLNMEVVAEGVETSAQRDKLAELGCTVAQGFLYGYPTSARGLHPKEANFPSGMRIR